jgi:hypothetical protein
MLTINQIEKALFETADGDMLDDDTELPVGELRRTLYEAFDDDAERAENEPSTPQSFECAAYEETALPNGVRIRHDETGPATAWIEADGTLNLEGANSWWITPANVSQEQASAADLGPDSAAYVSRPDHESLSFKLDQPTPDGKTWHALIIVNACRFYDDADIDQLIADGHAEVLRVGTGKVGS